MRAMTFERLVRDERFVSQLLTAAVGTLQLDRPPESATLMLVWMWPPPRRL